MAGKIEIYSLYFIKEGIVVEQNIKEKFVEITSIKDTKEILIYTLTFALMVVVYIGGFFTALTLLIALFVRDLISYSIKISQSLNPIKKKSQKA